MDKKLILLVLALVTWGCAGTHPVPWVSTPQYEVEYDLAWDLTVGLFEQKYILETVDKESGLIKTDWSPLDVSGMNGNSLGGTDQVGVRITCRVEGRCPFQLKLKVEKGILQDGEWTPVWVEYCRESICQRCDAGRDWIDEDLEKKILKDLSLRLQN